MRNEPKALQETPVVSGSVPHPLHHHWSREVSKTTLLKLNEKVTKEEETNVKQFIKAK